MLDYIKLRNFRAYRSESFSFSKLNILMGPNNSGKSSLISALNLIAQTAQNASTDKGTLKLNGEFDELGTYIDVVHGNFAASPLGIDFGFNRTDVSLEFKYRAKRREIELRKFDLTERGVQTFGYSKPKDTHEFRIPGRGGFKLTSRHISPQHSFNGFWPNIPFQSMRFRREREMPEDEMKKVDFSLRSLARSQYNFQKLFDQFDSLGAFRDRPQRTYTYSGEVADRIGRSGDNGILLLANNHSSRTKASKEIVEEINNFFKTSGIAESVFVKSLTRRHYEVCIVGHDGKDHNICDVGFGCSQVLPVLMAGLNLRSQIKSGSSRSKLRPKQTPMFVVQEPEIHLHPNAQAALGSYFVGLTNSGLQSFVETHSDHMVLRVARHIARGDISPSDVKLFFVSPTASGPEIHRMSFDSKGKFEPDWPGDFMPHRKDESLELARDRLMPRIFDEEEQLAFEYL